MKKISLILFLCIIAFPILRAEDKSVIKLIPVYEKTFQDTIVDVIFDTATVSITKAKEMGWKDDAFNEEEKRIGNAIISYSCVLITKDKISFFNKEGKEKRIVKRIVEGIKWEGKEGIHIGRGRIHVRKSKNGEYLALAIPREGSSLGEGEKGDLVIYRKDGQEMWRVENVYLSDGIITPSPNGEYAIALPPGEYPEQPPFYYSKEGLIKLIPKEWNGKWVYPFYPGIPSFSYAGEYFTIPINSDGDSTFFLKFNQNKQLWWKTIEGKIYSIKISNTGKYIVVSSESTTKCFNINGEILWKRKPCSSIFSFDKNDDLLVLAYSRKGKIECLNSVTGEIMWAFEDKSLMKKSTLIEINIKDSKIIVIGKLWQYMPPKGAECICILSANGKVLFKEFLSSNFLTKTYFDSEGANKGAHLSQDGRYIIFSPYTGNIRIVKYFSSRGEK